MNTQSLSKRIERMPSLFEDFLNKPIFDLFDGGLSSRLKNVPAVNISERKEDFKIAVEGNLLTISSEKEEQSEEKDETYTRQEYSYSSFERSFSLPDEVNKDKIDAHYQDGVLQLVLPKKEEAKKMTISKKIAVK